MSYTEKEIEKLADDNRHYYDCAEEYFAFGDGVEVGSKLWPRPIPISERLPEAGQRVLVCADGRWGKDVDGWHSAKFVSDDRATDQGSCNGGFKAIAGPCHWRVNEITHWLPLPPKPE